MNATQTPQQEYQERATEQAAAWFTIPQLAAVQNLRQLWGDAHQRVKDSHAAQMKAIGGEATEAEMPGDIGISGDHTTTVHNHYTTPPSVMPSLLKKCLPLAATLALGGAAGIAAPLLLAWWNKPPAVTQPAPTQPQDGWQLGIEVVNP